MSATPNPPPETFTDSLNAPLRIGHLYPELMNLYGDRGNILALVQRCRWRGIPVTVRDISVDDTLDPDSVDLLFMGGGQDAQQHRVCDDLRFNKAEALHACAKQRIPILGICGGYQLFGHYFDPIDGQRIQGIGLLDVYTVGGQQRLIGNVLIQRPDGTTLVGFENHSGQTHLGDNTQPLGKVLTGNGNNAESKQEGAINGTVYGTYLHGALLPKNPHFTDELLTLALQHATGQNTIALPPLNDDAETKAHQCATALRA